MHQAPDRMRRTAQCRWKAIVSGRSSRTLLLSYRRRSSRARFASSMKSEFRKPALKCVRAGARQNRLAWEDPAPDACPRRPARDICGSARGIACERGSADPTSRCAIGESSSIHRYGKRFAGSWQRSKSNSAGIQGNLGGVTRGTNHKMGI